MNPATNQPSILTLRLGQSDQAGQGTLVIVWLQHHLRLLPSRLRGRVSLIP